MSRSTGGDIELPWWLDDPAQCNEEYEAVSTGRRFRWRDYPGKIVLAAPCLAAVLTVSVWAAVSLLSGRGIISPSMRASIDVAAFLVNWGLSIIGAGAGGTFLRGTTDERVGAGIGACVVGLFGYILALIGLGVVTLITLIVTVFLIGVVVYLLSAV